MVGVDLVEHRLQLLAGLGLGLGGAAAHRRLDLGLGELAVLVGVEILELGVELLATWVRVTCCGAAARLRRAW